MKTVPRYVVFELGKWFLISLTALTLIIVVFGVAQEAMKRSLPPGQVLLLIPYVLPDALRMAVPATLLLSTASVFGRLSSSNEITALKSLGITPLALFTPLWVGAFLISLATVWLNDIAASWGREGVKQVVLDSVEEIAYGMLRSQRQYGNNRFSINVRDVQDRKLIKPIVVVQGKQSLTISAEEAELVSDQEKSVFKVILTNASIDFESKVAGRFPNTPYELEIPLAEATDIAPGRAPPSWLALAEIHRQVPGQEERIRQYEVQMAEIAASRMIVGDIEDLAGNEWETRANALAGMKERLYRLKTEPHRRWSAGFSCLCFVWVGAPMAVWLRNRDFLTSFFLCFLPILVVYYPLLAFGIDAAKSGTLPPSIVWLGNVLLVAWGFILLRKVIRY